MPFNYGSGGRVRTDTSRETVAHAAIALLAFLGGTWFPIPTHGFLHDVGQALPSYWLVQASHVAIGGHPMGTKGWAVIVAWTVVLAAVARRA